MSTRWVAFKTWGEADVIERELNGNPPIRWPKESIILNSESEARVLGASGYTVLDEQSFEEMKRSIADDFREYEERYLKPNDVFLSAMAENEEKILAGKRVLIRFKLKNLSEGINWPQAVWLHSRVKDWDVSVHGVGVFKVDLYNVLNSGDLESAVYMILSGVPDDMTQPYHWVTFDRMQWVAKEIQKELQAISKHK